jgi:hypothetical protein
MTHTELNERYASAGISAQKDEAEDPEFDNEVMDEQTEAWQQFIERSVILQDDEVCSVKNEFLKKFRQLL